nr:MAG TPA: hypothetical protein [Caudoviricetes sp.]
MYIYISIYYIFYYQHLVLQLLFYHSIYNT